MTLVFYAPYTDRICTAQDAGCWLINFGVHTAIISQEAMLLFIEDGLLELIGEL